jgi:hypothetical protein
VPAISPAEFIRRFVGASPSPQTPP